MNALVMGSERPTPVRVHRSARWGAVHTGSYGQKNRAAVPTVGFRLNITACRPRPLSDRPWGGDPREGGPHSDGTRAWLRQAVAARPGLVALQSGDGCTHSMCGTPEPVGRFRPGPATVAPGPRRAGKRIRGASRNLP